MPGSISIGLENEGTHQTGIADCEAIMEHGHGTHCVGVTAIDFELKINLYRCSHESFNSLSVDDDFV